MVAAIKRVVILGHSGFVGSHLFEYLKSNFPAIETIGRAPDLLDLTDEVGTQSLADIIDNTTAVVMCAAVKRQFGDTLSAYTKNMAMAVNLCHLLEKRPVARLIYFSSAAVYGEDIHNTAITEESCVQPRSYYGSAKFAAECLFRKHVEASPDTSLVCLRPPTIYGPGDLGETYGPSGFICKALRDEQITLWGDGTELREFIFIEDVVKIVSRLTFDNFTGVVNLASGTSYTFKQVLDEVSRVAGRVLHAESRPRTKRSVDNVFRNARLNKVLPDLGFVGIAEGVRRTYEAEQSSISSQIGGSPQA